MSSEERVQENGFDKLQENIGYRFASVSLLQDSLTHKSFANERNLKNYFGNERLEFLGDAVLELAISHILMERFQDRDEGDLSKMRAAIVNKDELSSLAAKLDIGKYILLSRGEDESMGRIKKSILANVYEALVAAVYYDGGYQEVFKMIEKHFELLIDQVAGKGFAKDFKSRLQEYSQKYLGAVPKYVLVTEKGPDHIKLFGIQVIINGISYGKGWGGNKKAAEQEAAEKTLEILLKEDDDTE